jgi:hypothetical protein
MFGPHGLQPSSASIVTVRLKEQCSGRYFPDSGVGATVRKFPNPIKAQALKVHELANCPHQRSTTMWEQTLPKVALMQVRNMFIKRTDYILIFYQLYDRGTAVRISKGLENVDSVGGKIVTAQLKTDFNCMAFGPSHLRIMLCVK